MIEIKISGSMVQAFCICHRQAWLMSRNITGDQYNEFIAIGCLISNETYKRDKKEIQVGTNKYDIIKEKNGKITLIEVKKSSRALEASKVQLLYYLYTMREKNIKILGEIRVPTEKKIIPIDLTEENIIKVEKIEFEIKNILKSNKSPEKKRIKYCNKCSYLEFCWA